MTCVKCGAETSQVICSNCGFDLQVAPIPLLTSVIFPPVAVDKPPADMQIEGTVLKRYTGHDAYVRIPEGVTVIGKSAFSRNKLIRVVEIPGTVQMIQKEAFWWCDSLKTVLLSSGLESIGEDAFCYCSALEEIRLPDTLKRINGSFKFSGLKQIIVPGSVEVVGPESFFCCENLRTVVLLPGVQIVGQNAFLKCKIEHIYVPDTLVEIRSIPLSPYLEIGAFSAPDWPYKRELHASDKWMQERPDLVKKILFFLTIPIPTRQEE